MSYKDPEKMKEYQRKWVNNRRVMFLKGKKCICCGGTNDLILSGARTKGRGTIFSYNPARIAALAKKGIIICRDCRFLTKEERQQRKNKYQREKRILDKMGKKERIESLAHRLREMGWGTKRL